MRNRTYRAAADLEAAASPAFEPAQERPTEITMVIDGAHIRAAHGYQSRDVDVTVGKIDATPTNRSLRFRLDNEAERFEEGLDRPIE